MHIYTYQFSSVQFPGFHFFLDFTISWISQFPGFHNFPDFTISWISLFSWISQFPEKVGAHAHCPKTSEGRARRALPRSTTNVRPYLCHDTHSRLGSCAAPMTIAAGVSIKRRSRRQQGKTPVDADKDKDFEYLTMPGEPLLWYLHAYVTSYVTYVWPMSQMNASCHIWMSHVAYEWIIPHMNESCHIWMSHVTYEWVMSQWIRHFA